jgi:pimeloyl-ACP methyl ester carboxylesterase
MAESKAPVDRFLTVNGLRLHYLEWDNESALPVIMLHGLRGYAHTWDPVAEPLRRSFRILALDQRGRGESDWGPWMDYWTEQYVADLESFVDQLELQHFVLVGHSMGGANSIVYAARHPDRVVAAMIEDMGPSASTTSEGSGRIKAELRNVPEAFDSWGEAQAYWRKQRPTASIDAIQSRMAHTLKELPGGGVGWKYDLQGIRQARLDSDPSRQVDLWPHVERMSCPTLVLRGEHSDFLSRGIAEDMRQRNPNFRWAEIASASHYVHDDNLDAFNEQVARFLQDVS